VTANAADRRRATALVCHYGRGSFEGWNAVVAEAADLGRVTALVIELVALHADVVPVLLTKDGVACVSDAIYRIVTAPAQTDEDPAVEDCRRAGRLMFAYAEDKLAEINAVLREAVDLGRATELVVAVLEMYRRHVPQMYSPLGLQVLERSILSWAMREDAGS
jgi:hypothetical protein